MVARTAGEIMTEKFSNHAVTEDTPLEDVAERLSKDGLNPLVVLRGDRLAGLITRTDLVRLVAVEEAEEAEEADEAGGRRRKAPDAAREDEGPGPEGQVLRAVDLIAHKRGGGSHAAGEVRWLVEAFLRQEVPDYQMAAWLMAVCWRGLEAAETRALTMALAESGRRLRYPGVDVPVVDKHSTGGVGDKTTLVLAPMLAAGGVAVAKMSGRGLGHTGGTIDKLEAIPGVRTSVGAEDFVRQVAQHHLALAAQSAELAPGDGRLYALRDVTATVESLPLIASSVMSKKIATGADAVVLDVKAGRGAFMQGVAEARALAQTMVALGREVDLPAVAVISSMSRPLGRAIGNALEVQEAVDTLRGQGPPDLLELSLVLGAEVLTACGAAPSVAGGARTATSDDFQRGGLRCSGGAGVPPGGRSREPDPLRGPARRRRCASICPPPGPGTWRTWTPSPADGRRWPWGPGGPARTSRSTPRWGSSCASLRESGWSGGRPWPPCTPGRALR